MVGLSVWVNILYTSERDDTLWRAVISWWLMTGYSVVGIVNGFADKKGSVVAKVIGRWEKLVLHSAGFSAEKGVFRYDRLHGAV